MEERSPLLDSLRQAMPIAPGELVIQPSQKIGLVIVDEVNGFATVGAGALAPRRPDPTIGRMIRETDRLARAFVARGHPILAFLDTHQPGKAEPPYPPHCEAGSGEEDLIPELRWLEGEKSATLIRKDCINGYIGAQEPAGRNRVADWVNRQDLRDLLVLGICTDICVMDFVLTLLSARNHGLMPSLTDIAVHAEACATYDLPWAEALALGLPATAAHPQELTHHAGLYFMAARGARLVDRVRFTKDA